MKKILVTGSLAFDYIMDFPESFGDHILPDKIKTLSVSFLVDNLNKNFGGTAGNIAYTLALLKQSSILLSSAGKKDFDDYRKHIDKTGIVSNFINIVDDEFTASAYIMTDKNNCQITGFYPGAMTKDETLSIKEIADFLIVAPTVPLAMDNFVNQAKEKNIPFLFDPAQALPRLTKEQLINGIEGSDIVIGNDYEIALVMEKTGFSKEQTLQMTKVLITTLGEKGSLIETKEQQVTVGIAKATTVVDPTGAGDAYIAGFVKGYLEKLPLKACGELGAVAASFAIEEYGTQKHSFTQESFENRHTHMVE